MYSHLKLIWNRMFTMSIVIFRNVCLCFLFKLTKISRSLLCNSLKATARWWFSKTDSSLYISASSEPENTKDLVKYSTMAWLLHTHELKNLHISAMAYYINTLDGERSVHGRCEPKCFKDGDLFWKICTSLYANFRKKISSDTSCGRSQTLPWFFM